MCSYVGGPGTKRAGSGWGGRTEAVGGRGVCVFITAGVCLLLQYLLQNCLCGSRVFITAGPSTKLFGCESDAPTEIPEFQPGPGGKRKDRPELFFPRDFTPPSDCLESRPCPPHPLGIGVWDASRLIEGEYRAQTGMWRLLGFVSVRTIKGRSSSSPETPPRHQGGGCTPLWTGTPTGAQLTLSRHYWVVI